MQRLNYKHESWNKVCNISCVGRHWYFTDMSALALRPMTTQFCLCNNITTVFVCHMYLWEIFAIIMLTKSL